MIIKNVYLIDNNENNQNNENNGIRRIFEARDTAGLYSAQVLLKSGENNENNENIKNNKNNKIKNIKIYAKSLIGIPYRWYKKGEVVCGDDKFWSANLPHITANKIKKKDKCIVCTGLINLIRRYLGLSIPGLDGKLGKISLKFPGTTWTWFRYLKKANRLEEIDFTKKYPIGTLLISNYKNIEEQGHVAIIISNVGNNIKKQKIIHSYSNYCYKDCLNMRNVGTTGIQKMDDDKILDWFKVTHICLPENWILKD
jgi:hypothetical protein